MKRFDLSGRTAIVTGVAGGLGRMWASALSEAGADVVGLDLPGTDQQEPYRSLQQSHAEKLLFVAADVRKRDDLERAAEAAARWRTSPSILVNNAGIDQPPGIVKTYTLDRFPLEGAQHVLDVNLVGAFQAMQVFGHEMCELRRGSIINITSLYASVSPDARLYEHLPTEPPFLKPPMYGASKAALVQLTRYFATHWGPLGVRVNALSPGGILGQQDALFREKFSSRVPLGRMGDALELVGPLLFLASDASSYVTGIELRVDGGFTAW